MIGGILHHIEPRSELAYGGRVPSPVPKTSVYDTIRKAMHEAGSRVP
jgi:hypothetical protein